jgi:hypothetical chaperone protein
MSACGLDFGTSNTTLGTWIDETPVLAALEAGHLTIPSAIFFAADGNVSIGRNAIDAYVEGVSGRLMRSLKSVLGTALIEETTRVGRERKGFRDVIAAYLGAVKRRAELATGRELTNLVHGRPVHFVDNSQDADRRAEATLRSIAQELGFKEVTFQFEPIAAALDYEREVQGEQIALIADIGGGTSDFSIVRLSPERHRKADRKADILANDGIRIGGTDFDRQLSLGAVMPLFGYQSPMLRAGLDVPSRYFHELATWSEINRLYDSKIMSELRQVRREAREPERLDRLIRVIDEQRGHTLAMEVEAAKIALTDAAMAAIPLSWVEPDLNVEIGRTDLVHHTRLLAERVAGRIKLCLSHAQLKADAIDALFLTGGSVRLSHLRKAMTKVLPSARIVEGDTFGAVGKGLTLEAARRYGPG